VRERIEYRFRVPSAAVFTLYSYSKALEYRFRVPTAGSLNKKSEGTSAGGQATIRVVPKFLQKFEFYTGIASAPPLQMKVKQTTPE
jgi:hypothetical protein